MLTIDKHQAKRTRRRLMHARGRGLSTRMTGPAALAVALIADAAADALAGDAAALAWFAGADAPLTYRQIAEALELPFDFLPEGLRHGTS